MMANSARCSKLVGETRDALRHAVGYARNCPCPIQDSGSMAPAHPTETRFRGLRVDWQGYEAHMSSSEQADGSNYRDDSKTIDESADGTNYRDDEEDEAGELADGSNLRDDSEGIAEVADGSNYREPPE